MPRTCTICGHPERLAIDRALTESTPNRRIATQYAVSESAVRRHRADHLPAHLATAHEAETVADATDLLGQLRALRERAMILLDKAEAAGDLGTALRAIAEARRTIETLLEVEGELTRRGTINIVVSAEWVQIRTVIIGALADHPAARLSVAEALASIEGGTGHVDR